MSTARRTFLILASASPRRRAILRSAGVRFRVDPSRVDEGSREKDPRRLVVALARRKALEVSRRHPELPVLGADTIVVCAGELLGKPRDLKDAARMITLQSGRWQRVYTGTALVVGRRVFTDLAVTKVKARRLDAGRLRRLSGKHMDKAGAYAVQDDHDPLVEKIVGDRDNVVGLPMRSVRRLLARAAAARRNSEAALPRPMARARRAR
ncbi:MAG: septum formation protein Maf [Elusimicrobia bacterium GWA2_66_18]|nr:MAG: septum formation protein Maf [Elusimicrobia bacterium GWA2_66_18]